MSNDKSISASVATGVAWMLVLRLGVRALGLISTMVLARLLTPEDFGIVAIAMSFFALLLLVKDFGFDTVIIQMRNPTSVHYNTAWTFNFIFGLTLSLIFIGFSGVIANFFGEPDLEMLIWAIASLFIISGLESVGTLDFRKNLTFDKEFKLKIIPKLIGVPCTLILAYWLRSYWALTIGTILTQLAALSSGYLMHSYRPRFSLGAAKELFNFSKWLMINNFIYFINNRSPELFIGKILNPQAAGLFSVANEVASMPTTELSSAVSRASYPGYAKVSNDYAKLKSLFIDVISYSALFLFPVAVGVTLTADLLVPVFLGDQWLPAIPLIEVISLAGLLIALNSPAGYVFMALGNPKISTLLGTFRVFLFVPLMVIFTNEYGVEGAAWAMFCTASVMFFVGHAIIVLKLPVTVKDLTKAFYRPILASAVMFLCIYPFSQIGQNSTLFDTLLQLFVVSLCGASIYFLSLYILWSLSGKPEGPESKIYPQLFKLIKTSD
jgi:O-antigen/teichoic acid export membrane protein